MKRPSRAGGGKPSKARSHRPSRLVRNIESKAAAPRSAATQQVAEWLEKLGMSEQAKSFAENDVDLSVLPHLTDHDLKELGVSLGHRRKMLAAIAELAGAVQAPSQPTQTESKPQNTAERRQVTVMFSDLAMASEMPNWPRVRPPRPSIIRLTAQSFPNDFGW
jgi:hypothetical protein